MSLEIFVPLSSFFLPPPMSQCADFVFYRDLSERLNLSKDDGEKWIVNLIRETRMGADAKIDLEKVCVVIFHFLWLAFFPPEEVLPLPVTHTFESPLRCCLPLEYYRDKQASIASLSISYRKNSWPGSSHAGPRRCNGTFWTTSATAAACES